MIQMNKNSKCFFVAIFMCLGVASAFQQCNGMGKKIEFWPELSETQYRKVQKGFLTEEQILIGIDYWNEFQEIENSDAYTDENKLELLKDAAIFGSEEAVNYISFIYRYGLYGLEKNDPRWFKLAEEYAEKGSEQAILLILCAYRYGWHGLQENDKRGLEMAKKYADLGSEEGIYHLLVAHINGLYGLEKNDSKGLELAEKYAGQGSQIAGKYLKKTG